MTDLRERFRDLDDLAVPDLREVLDRPRIARRPAGGSGRRVLTAAVALAVAAAGFAVATKAFRTGPSEPVASVENGPVAFVGEVGSDGESSGAQTELFAVEPDGSGLRRLTDDASAFDWRPAWSPDGMRIAFVKVGETAERSGLFVMDADGSDVSWLAEDETGAGSPSWSPDGATIAFDSGRAHEETGEGGRDLYLVDVAGGAKPVRLTSDPASEVQPAWSPDGSQIAFVRYESDSDTDIYLLDVRDGGVSRLTDGPEADFRPAWSPDGTRIAFERAGDIYAMNADGSRVERLTDDPAFDGEPAWSPDGTRIAFSSDRDGDAEIFVMNPDGSNPTQLTHNNVGDTEPSWGAAADADPAPSPEVLPIDPRVTATIPVGAFPRAVAAGEGAVWASVDNAEGGPDDQLVLRIDPATNEVVETIPVPEAGDIAIGEGAVWVTTRLGPEGDGIVRIDPDTNDVVASVLVGFNVSDVAVGDGAVWVTTNTTSTGFRPSGKVIRIDPATNAVVARIPVDGGWPRDVVVGEGSVWVYGHSGYTTARGWLASSLWQIDPATNELVEVILQDGFLGDGGALPDNVAVGEGFVWAADDRGGGLRIDPATGDADRFDVEGGFSWPFTVYGGRVWFWSREIRALDPATNEVGPTVDPGVPLVDTALDPATGTLWVAGYEDVVVRIDLRRRA